MIDLKANQMFETIRSTLNERFDGMEWLDESTRLVAKHKIKAINKFIAYTDELIDLNKIDHVHLQLHDLRNDTLFENLLKLQKWNLDTEYSALGTINNRNESDFHLLTNSYFNWFL